MNYIYGLLCPIALTIRYVGKSNDPDKRFKHHLWTCARNSHHTARWISKLKKSGMSPTVVILAALEDSEDWQKAERYYIASAAEFGWKLTNTNPGGEGGGYIRPEDKANWVEKIRASLCSDEVRARISAGVVRAYANPEVRNKASNRMRSRWRNPDYRSQMSQRVSAAMSTPENRKKVSDRSRAAMAAPGARDMVSKRLSDYYATEEGRQNKIRVSRSTKKVKASRDGQIKNWSKREYRQRMIAAKTSPKVIAVQKAKAREQWANPEVRERMLSAMKNSHANRKAEMK